MIKPSKMLSQAYVLEDGRCVFKTEGGTQVFNEFETVVQADEVDPLQIDDSLPTWVAFSAKNELEQTLEVERAQNFKFQGKVDAAREQIAEGDITEADLEAIGADLFDTMLPAVRDHVAGIELHIPLCIGSLLSLSRSGVLQDAGSGRCTPLAPCGATT